MKSTLATGVSKELDTHFHGTPQSLLNTKWQKRTRNLNCELDETIYVEQSIEKPTPILIGNYYGFYRDLDEGSILITLFDTFRLGEPVPTDDQGYHIDEIRFSKDIDALTASEFLRDINEMARVS